MERTLIANLAEMKGKEVLIQGWVSVRRDQGKMVFFDFRDRSGTVQGVVLPNSLAIENAKDVRNEYVVSVKGKVNERPPKNIKEGILNGDIELEVTGIIALSKAELPFERDAEVNLDTYLDHLPYTLRTEKAKQIFKVQEAIIQGFRDGMRGQDFVEFQAPALVGGDAEGGASAFEVDYYYDKKAYLATSPQFYISRSWLAYTSALLQRPKYSAAKSTLLPATFRNILRWTLRWDSSKTIPTS